MLTRIIVAVACLTAFACGEGITEPLDPSELQFEVGVEKQEVLNLTAVQNVGDPSKCWSDPYYPFWPVSLVACSYSPGNYYLSDPIIEGGTFYYRFSTRPDLSNCLQASGSSLYVTTCASSGTSAEYQKFELTELQPGAYQAKNKNGGCIHNSNGTLTLSYWCVADPYMLWRPRS
jgi:hypothetical protein